MEFSVENLKTLLVGARCLHLLPADQRQAFIDTALSSPLEEQERIFNILKKSKEESDKAEQEYAERVTTALDNFVADVQMVQKKTINDLRVKAEKKEREKDDAKLNDLLNSI